MVPIYPINKKHIKPFYGRMVCVVTQDGHRYIGRLSGCRKGKLILNENYPNSVNTFAHSKSVSKSKKSKKKNRKTVSPKSFIHGSPQLSALAQSPYAYGPFKSSWRQVDVDLGSVAHFLLPFI